jgi:predicted nucleic acid-binding protein
MAYLAANPQTLLHITPVVAGELASGRSLAARESWEAFIGRFTTLPITPDVTWEFGRISRYLRESGQMIGANDMWIAATAIAHDLPLLTRNEREFRRVPGLTVSSYPRGPGDPRLDDMVSGRRRGTGRCGPRGRAPR